VSQSVDRGELSTDYEYDKRGRLRWVKPETGSGAWIEYAYQGSGASTQAGALSDWY
jgi:hypothetical protein